MTRFIVTVEVDEETGELVLPIPDDMLEQVGWKAGDTLLWKERGDGSYELSKKVAQEGQPE